MNGANASLVTDNASRLVQPQKDFLSFDGRINEGPAESVALRILRGPTRAAGT